MPWFRIRDDINFGYFTKETITFTNVSGVVVPSMSSNTALTLSKISCSSGALRFFVGDAIVSNTLSFLALLNGKGNSGACSRAKTDWMTANEMGLAF